MQAQIVSAKLSTVLFDQVILVLDTCDLDLEIQNKTIVFIKSLLNRLPHNTQKSIYFMGNPLRYSDYLFESQAALWFEQNQSRASLITPIIRQFDVDFRARTILIGSNPIFDIDDWLGHGIIENAIQVCLGNTKGGESVIHQVLFDPTVDEISLLTNNPINSVQIQGKGLMPIHWSNSDYRIEQYDNTFSLIADATKDYFVELTALISDPNSLLYTINYFNGQQECRQLPTNISAQPVLVKDHSKHAQLTAEEIKVFRRASTRQNFICPHCGHTHDWNELHCYGGESLIGNYIYPSVPPNWRGLVLFYDAGHQIFFENRPNNIFLKGNNKVVLILESKVQIRSFNATSEEWELDEESIENYLEVGNGTFLVFL